MDKFVFKPFMHPLQCSLTNRANHYDNKMKNNVCVRKVVINLKEEASSIFNLSIKQGQKSVLTINRGGSSVFFFTFQHL